MGGGLAAAAATTSPVLEAELYKHSRPKNACSAPNWEAGVLSRLPEQVVGSTNVDYLLQRQMHFTTGGC